MAAAETLTKPENGKAFESPLTKNNKVFYTFIVNWRKGSKKKTVYVCKRRNCICAFKFQHFIKLWLFFKADVV